MIEPKIETLLNRPIDFVKDNGGIILTSEKIGAALGRAIGVLIEYLLLPLIAVIYVAFVNVIIFIDKTIDFDLGNHFLQNLFTKGPNQSPAHLVESTQSLTSELKELD